MPIWYSIIPFLSLHENGMTITALDADRNMLYRQTYYSIGGGFIVDEAHFGQEEENRLLCRILINMLKIF